ncbi:unnamed protein product [Candidula unifasciata]|uniref:Alpha-1,3-glucosyltransferase n=1 Tax=Candidula unifasciata TaxID=100452 RepID=A0A8S3ZYR2_9EUPU|nr:unnamed protein product [Candidula unifasciata]
MAVSTYHGHPLGVYLQVLLILLGALTVRLCVSMWGYSGQGKPPMFGDLEAQRHWMEVTVNLPTSEWYVQTDRNDLQYWGLDYPPLTAYHMMLNGKIALRVNPQLVALNVSRGIEDADAKVFMRATVLLMDALFFLPAVAAYFLLQQPKVQPGNDFFGFVAVLAIYPGLILIDNGHFQYNNISLGLLVLATLAIAQRRDFIGAVLFCCALNYKQMELYHALPFFAYLLGSCFRTTLTAGLKKLVSLALIVLVTFAATWFPFLWTVESALAVVQRLFPVKRGLYEDKVANFWCSVSVLIKFKEKFADSDMALICLSVTSICLLPSFLHLLKNPTIRSFHYALINTSLVFFLFSFHVHEKSILLAAIPACLVVKSDPFAVVWFLLISVFSMLPLLLKDGLLIPTLATTGLFWLIVTHLLNPTRQVSPQARKIFTLSLLIAVCMVLATLFIPPPKRFPDIFPLLISIYSCGHFFIFAGHFHLRQFGRESFLLSTSNSDGHFDSAYDASESAVPNGNNDVRKSPKEILNASKVKHRKHQK